MLIKNQIYDALICDYTAEGQGIAKIEGCAVFIPNAIVGERCRVRIVKAQKTWAAGKLVEILERSPHRVNRECPVAKQCGGCDFWHMDYTEETRLKAERVRQALNRLGGENLEQIPILDAPTCYGYRNKAQYPVSQEKGKAFAGFFRAGTHQVVENQRCLILPQEADQVKKLVIDYVNHYRITAYNEETHRGLLRHIYVRRGSVSGQVLVCLVLNGRKLPHQEVLIEKLKAVPGFTSLVLSVNTKQGNTVLGDEFITLYGPGYIEDTLCGLTFRLSPRSFYQVNHHQAQRLYQAAISQAGITKNDLVLDLYCGVGTITLCMAQAAGKVIGVEVVEQAVIDARENALRNGIENAEFFCGDAGKAALALEEQGIRADVVVVDPPRKGLNADTIEALHRMSPRRIVYVSCDPATLARDVALLKQRGYVLKSAQAADLFPRCSHVESVVCLSREKANAPSQNFRIAQQDDAEHVLSLYQSAKSSAFCVWNDSYPSIAEIEHDLETKNLYVLTDDSKVIGAISVVPENELDDFDCWSCKDGKEIARVVIDKAYQGYGLSFEMVQGIASILRKNGCKAIHLSVVKTNVPAYKTYIKAGFAVVGEAQMYGNDYYLMEKAIDTKFQPKRNTDETVAVLNRQMDVHNMKLHCAPFQMIKSGKKTIELRLLDEKRQQIKAGDTIVFTNTTTGETLDTTVAKLHRFDNFEELYKSLPLLQCGYTKEDIDKANPTDMEQYYSVEEQKKYGVVGIELYRSEQITDESQ